MHTSSNGDGHGNDTLSLEHMKWAVNFLAVSQKKADALVSTSIAQITQESDADMATRTGGSESLNPTTTTPILPDTKQLISMCLCFMSVVRRGTSSAVPPLITQKLMERLLELLEPRYDGNMDLYAELRSAAEGVLPPLHQPSSSSM